MHVPENSSSLSNLKDASIYVNNMKNSIQSPLYLVQYADDTFLFVAAKDIATGVDYLQKAIKELSDFFAIHRLNVNADKTVHCFL